MKKLNKIGYLPKSVRIAWIAMRVGLLIWGIYGLFHGSTVEFLQAIFAIIFTHLWDMFQLFGGKSFITKVSYEYQTMLNAFIFFGCVIGTTLNNRTSFQSSDLINHTIAGFISAYFGYDFAVLLQGKKGRLSPALASMFGLAFALAISVGWEFYEFSMDRLYGLHLQCSTPTSEAGLIDTMVDFIMAAVGALIGMFYISFKRNGVFGKTKKQIKAQNALQKKQDEEKERVWNDYLRKKSEKEKMFEEDSYFHGQSDGFAEDFTRKI